MVKLMAVHGPLPPCTSACPSRPLETRSGNSLTRRFKLLSPTLAMVSSASCCCCKGNVVEPRRRCMRLWPVIRSSRLMPRPARPLIQMSTRPWHRFHLTSLQAQSLNPSRPDGRLASGRCEPPWLRSARANRTRTSTSTSPYNSSFRNAALAAYPERVAIAFQSLSRRNNMFKPRPLVPGLAARSRNDDFW